MTSRNEMTGSQNQREEEIQNHWLVFQPISDHKSAVNDEMFSAPIGQTFMPEMLIHSGSYPSVSGAIQVIKTIHMFESEASASEFITEIGPKNIAMVKEITSDDRTWIEVYLLEFSSLNFDMEILDFEEREGYRLEIFRSGSQGLQPFNRKIEKNSQGNIISDTYLKFFDIEEGDENA